MILKPSLTHWAFLFSPLNSVFHSENTQKTRPQNNQVSPFNDLGSSLSWTFLNISENFYRDLLSSTVIYTGGLKIFHMKKQKKLLHESQILLKRALVGAGPRYSSDLNVKTKLEGFLSGFTHDEDFISKWRSQKDGFQKSFEDLPSDSEFEEASKLLKSVKDKSHKLLETFSWLGKTSYSKKSKKEMLRLLKQLQDISYKVSELIPPQDEQETIDNQKLKPGERKISNRERLDYLKSRCRKHQGSIYDLVEFIESIETNAALYKIAWISGEAGIGKTHSLCDFASNRLQSNKVTLILLGSHLSAKNFWQEIGNLCGKKITNSKDFSKLFSSSIGKTLLIIDAINESTYPSNWKKILGELAKLTDTNDSFRIAVSCRSTYVPLCKPQSLFSKNKILEYEHHGFADNSLSATSAFFKHYHIKPHEIPISFEFNNPLFLKIYCKTLVNQKKDSHLTGHRGMTWIIEEFIKSVDANEIAPKLGYENDIQKVKSPCWDISKVMAKQMADSGTDYLNRSTCEGIASQILTKKSLKGSIIQLMLNAGLLLEDIQFVEGTSTNEKIIRFPYQKFSDFLIGRYYANKMDKSLSHMGFGQGYPLHFIIQRPYKHAGLIEALSSLVPEWYGSELIDLIPTNSMNRSYYKAFLQSLIWRDWGRTISEASLKSIKHKLRAISRNEVFRILLTVCSNPSHPLNANYLNFILKRIKISERDAFWTTALEDLYQHEDGPIERIITWSKMLDSIDLKDNQSFYLLSITIPWLFSSPQRFLRDRSTKALVAVIERYPDKIIELLRNFQNIDDPYIEERVLCAVYGAILRTEKYINFDLIRDYIFEAYFKDIQKISPNVLIRDYARSIFEYSNSRSKSKLKSIKLYPPFKTSWPKRIPSLKTLEKKYEKSGKGLRQVYSSIAGFPADFGNYIIGRHRSNWKYIEAPVVKLKKDLVIEFQKKLNSKQKRLYNFLVKQYPQRNVYEIILSDDIPGLSQGFNKALTEKQLQTIDLFVKELGSSLHPKRRKYFHEKILREIDRIHHKKKDDSHKYISNELIQRFVLMKILSSGYYTKQHEEYDNTPRSAGHSRDSHKAERIGKKYQWIFLYEALGRLSDNFYFAERYSDKKIKSYKGTWQLSSIQNIDPTTLVSGKQDLENTRLITFKDGINYSSWNLMNGKKWLDDLSDLPNIRDLIFRKDIHGKKWVSIDGGYFWKSGKKEPHQDLSIITEGYLVRTDEFKRYKIDIEKMISDFDFSYGSSSDMGCFLEEYYWSTPYLSNHKEYQNEDRKFTKKIFTKYSLTEEYSSSSSDYDCSTEEHFSIMVPSLQIIKSLPSKIKMKEGVIRYKNEIVCCDSVFSNSDNNSLYFSFEHLKDLLISKKFILLILYKGEKLIVSEKYEASDGPRFREYYGCLSWNGNRIVQIKETIKDAASYR